MTNERLQNAMAVAHVEESFEVAFFSPQEVEQLNMHPSTYLRIKHYLEHRLQPVIG